MRTIRPIEERRNVIHAVAADQGGIVTRKQLLRAGLSADSIDRRLLNGSLSRLHAGVYQVGPIVAQHAAERAAMMACGGGVLSHETAAAILDIKPSTTAAAVVSLTVSRSAYPRRRKGIRTYRRDLPPDEIMRALDFEVTTPSRTILDLASVGDRHLAKAIARAEHSDASLRQKVTTLLDRYPTARGARGLRALLLDTPASSFTRSAAEDALLAMIRSAGLPYPASNVTVAGYEVDFLWRSAGLVVEVDGYEFHSSKPAFKRDRRRDLALAAAGMQVVRLSWDQLTAKRDRTLVELARILFHHDRRT